jgi:hypothetical protein
MDTRRLCCLVVHQGLVVSLAVHDRTALVRALQWELARHLVNGNHSIAAHEDLTLFVARHNDEWLSVASRDAQRLAFEDPETHEPKQQRFVVPQNAMNPQATVHDYFPVQPPLANYSSALLHVLACVGLPKPKISLTPRQESGVTARLVVSATRTRMSLVHRHSLTNGSNSTPTLRPLVLRCASPDGILWLSRNDDASKAMLFVPPAWRQLAAELFCWLSLGASTTSRRAVLTGAPRGGKSAFLGFLLVQLVRLARPRPVCIVDAPGVTFARISETREVLEGTRGVDFQDDLRDPETLYLFDASASDAAVQPLEVAARSLVVVSYVGVPRHTNRTRSFVLPTWTLEDVRLCRHLAQRPLKGVRALYDKWGGVPGRLVTSGLAASAIRLETVLTQLNHDQILHRLAKLQRTHQWHDVATGPDSDRWRALVIPVANATTDGFAFHGHVAFTSMYVCDRVLEMLPLRTWTIRRREAQQMPTLWTQIRMSLAYLAQEEEEKHETPPPTEAAGKRGGRWSTQRLD